MKNYILLAAIISSVSLSLIGCGKNDSSTTTTIPPANTDVVTTTKPDNTAINKADRNTGAMTPMDQSESSSDIRISADIRRAVMDDKDLSTDAHNAKIITDKGLVTLRGVVDNAAEKDSLESKAKAVAGVTSVDNQLTIKNP